jgi:hypothetical protein
MSSTPFWKSHVAYGCAIFAIGFFFSWLPLVLAPPVIANPDEVFQALEPGHRLAFGYGMVPWEFDYGARSWALGYLAALPMALAGFLGKGPDFYLPLTWAFFALGAGVMTLCAGLWGARFHGRGPGLAAALVSAGWIDNLYFGGRSFSEVVGVHILVAALFLAEPGYKVENRNRLLAAGFAATLASMLRMQLGPVALLLWLWHWRDRQRVLQLSLGAVAALAFTGLFDLLTWDYPFQPVWQNIRFNLMLGGADSFGVAPWSAYFEEMWLRWGLLAIPFLLLAALGARRLPILAAMTVLTIAIHVVIPHKEYRFVLPAVMMASILAGLGAVEAARGLARLLRGALREAAGATAALLVGLLWLAVSAGNLGALAYEAPWRGNSAILRMVMEISRKPSICGVGFANLNRYAAGGYTFLHRPVPVWFDNNNVDQLEAFIGAAKGYNALVLRQSNLEFFGSLPAYANYGLDHCAEDYCLLIRPGDCAALPVPRPEKGALSAGIPGDARYPYAAGISP